jgi:hypothetical protein
MAVVMMVVAGKLLLAISGIIGVVEIQRDREGGPPSNRR